MLAFRKAVAPTILVLNFLFAQVTVAHAQSPQKYAVNPELVNPVITSGVSPVAPTPAVPADISSPSELWRAITSGMLPTPPMTTPFSEPTPPISVPPTRLVPTPLPPTPPAPTPPLIPTTVTRSSVTDDILSTGNSPTQVSIPMAACSFLVNSQNVCTETNVTTATAIVSVAVLGGIIALVTTAVNNQANSNEQRQKDNNLLLTLLALQNSNKSSGAAAAKVCYDSATPPNVIPCP